MDSIATVAPHVKDDEEVFYNPWMHLEYAMIQVDTDDLPPSFGNSNLLWSESSQSSFDALLLVCNTTGKSDYPPLY